MQEQVSTEGEQHDQSISWSGLAATRRHFTFFSLKGLDFHGDVQPPIEVEQIFFTIFYFRYDIKVSRYS